MTAPRRWNFFNTVMVLLVVVVILCVVVWSMR